MQASSGFHISEANNAFLREVVNEYDNTQKTQSRKMNVILKKLPVMWADWSNNAGGRCLLSASLIKKKKQKRAAPSTDPQSRERSEGKKKGQ